MSTTISKQPLDKYTESQWDREVGVGKCPPDKLWKLEKEKKEEADNE